MAEVSYDKDKMERIKSILKENGYKLTPQRRAIVEMIINSKGNHLTTEEIYNLVKLNCPEIGLATVYRTVLLLDEIGVVARLDLNDGCSRYELVSEHEHHRHHHLICTNCGKVLEVEGDLLEDLEEKIEKKYEFKIEDHSVKFYGICEECLKKSK